MTISEQVGNADFCNSKEPSPTFVAAVAATTAALDMMEYSASLVFRTLNGESRSGSKRNERPRSVGNPGMGRFPGLRFVPRRPGPGRPFVAAASFTCAARGRHQPAFHGHYPLSKYDSCAAAGAFPGKPGDGAPDQESGAVECPGDGGSGQQDPGRDWRTYLDVRFGRDLI